MSRLCAKCGAAMSDTATFCKKCGQRAGTGAASAPSPNAAAAPPSAVPAAANPVPPSPPRVDDGEDGNYYRNDTDGASSAAVNSSGRSAGKKSSCCIFNFACLGSLAAVLAVLLLGGLVLWWWNPWDDDEPAGRPGIAVERTHEPRRSRTSRTRTPKRPPDAVRHKTKRTPDTVKPSEADRDKRQTGQTQNAESKDSEAEVEPGERRQRRFSQDGAERISVAKGQKDFSASCGVSVNLGRYNAIKDTDAFVKPHNPDTKSVPGGVRRIYSIELKGYEQFDDLITLTLPYDPSQTDPKNEKGSVFAEYRDKKSGEWVTVKHRVDTARHEVIITTDHLSDYCVVTVKDSNTPYAKLSSLESLYLDDQTAVQVLQEFQQKDADKRPKSASLVKQFYASLILLGKADVRAASGADQEEQIAGLHEDAEKLMKVDEDTYGLINDTMGWLGDLANLTSCDPALASLGGQVSDFTLGLSAASLCATMANLYRGEGDPYDAAVQAVHLLYGRGGYFYSKYATGAMKIANIGVIFIDYSLNKFMTEADKTYKEAIFNALVYYNEKMHPRTEGEWYQLLYKAYKQTNGNKMRFSALLQHIFTSYSERFFDAPYQEQTICAREAGVRGYTSGQFYIRDDAKAYCTKQYVARLGQSEMMQRVFERLCERISYDCDRELEKQLTVLRRSLNEPLIITVTELAKGGKSKYAGGTAVLRSRRGKKAGYWQLRLDENGCGKVEATVLGYMQAGLPAVLEIWPVGSDPDHDKPAINLTFKVSQKTTDLKVVTNLKETASPTPEKTKETAAQPYKEEQLKSFSGIYIIPKQMRKPDVGNKFGPLYPFSSYLSEFEKKAQKDLEEANARHKKEKGWKSSSGYKSLKERVEFYKGKDKRAIALTYGVQCSVRFRGKQNAMLNVSGHSSRKRFSNGGYPYGSFADCGFKIGSIGGGVFDEASMTFTGEGVVWDMPRGGSRIGVRERTVKIHISPGGATFGDRSFDVYVDPADKVKNVR